MIGRHISRIGPVGDYYLGWISKGDTAKATCIWLDADGSKALSVLVLPNLHVEIQLPHSGSLKVLEILLIVVRHPLPPWSASRAVRVGLLSLDAGRVSVPRSYSRYILTRGVDSYLILGVRPVRAPEPSSG